MAFNTKRVVVSISSELEKEVDDIRNEQFCDRPYSEVYRYIFSLGLKTAKESEKAKERK